jgi:hypothetical protein
MLKRINIFLIFSVVAAFVSAQNLEFSDWDNDQDGMIELFEFTDNFTEYHYTDIDKTNDKGLDDEDFFHYTYDYMDGNRDGVLGDEEWLVAYDYMLNDYIVHETVDHYDLNKDGYIDYDEYYSVLYNSDLYSVWDVDNDLHIDEHELAYAVFVNWDADNSNTWSRGEYRNFDAFYADI